MVDFKIDNEEDGFTSEPVAVFAGAEESDANTALASLKNRRAQIVDEMYIDVQVPRWESPEIFVRFKPVSTVKLSAAIDRRRKQKGDDWSLLANADMLIESCIGIYAVLDGDHDKKFSLNPGDPLGAWTKFDPTLGKVLGVDVQRATDVVKELYLTEGDLIDTANKLFKWSNVANDEADESF
jgi:hypothetical protein